MIKVLALVPYPSGRAPGQRYRIEQWAPLLRDEGVHVRIAPFLSPLGMDVLYEQGHTAIKVRETVLGYVKRFTELMRSVSADVIFVYREAALLGPAWLERLFSARLPLVFDFDDAIYLTDTSAVNAWSRRFKSRDKTATICRLARHVIVGNEFLATFARHHARDVTVVPSTIDTDLYRPHPRPQHRVPVVGWTGSTTTVPYLKALTPALKRLRGKREFVLRVIGARMDSEDLAVEYVPWRPEFEALDLGTLDIGLMPLPDDEWSRGKCGMKALQYMALGIPPVVAPIGVNTVIVRDGVNGLYARTEEEWIDRVTLLLDDEALRWRLGQQARKTVEELFSARTHAPRVARVIAEAAGVQRST